ncbi:MAG: ATP-binding cassette domain-containing protein [Oscillospiraceae bacterium]|nr:ATP-binding cassette domain-containing protein [Oscillospiraceae bacterium]
MLSLKNITKDYISGDSTVSALKGISIDFRKSEFVSVLGPSGCGKTTLLNIIGGLDQYTSGDLVINGRSTKEYVDSDWDAYRNRSVGFVFQNYNLIPHQSVLSNVELALTLSGVSKSERRRRAVEALEKVGLGDQIRKRPNQMSGGQMQRVAIARALVNDPDILLADEPTGALDTETSIQVLDILKEVAKDRLVIMVTHNPDLAERYSTRIVRLLDGRITDDSDPYAGGDETADDSPERTKKVSMSFGTALSLSLNNLLTKKTRTILTAFAGSIGIIGIALILSLSNGIQNYIDKVQEDTLSAYPLEITAESMDIGGLLSSIVSARDKSEEHGDDAVYSSTVMSDMLDSMVSMTRQKNNLSAFKEYLESGESGIGQYVSEIRYGYGTTLNIYSADTIDGVTRINPTSIFDGLYDSFTTTDDMMSSAVSVSYSMYSMDIWEELLENRELLDSQYDVVAGRWPQQYDEVVLVIDENNEINDVFLYALGLKDPDEIKEMLGKLLNGETISAETESWTYDELLDLEFRLVLPTDYYRYNETEGFWEDMTENETYMTYVIDNAEAIKVVGIIRPNGEAVTTAMHGAVGYTKELGDYVAAAVDASEIVKQQTEDKETDVFTGLKFDDGSLDDITDAEKADMIKGWFSSLTEVEKAALYTQLALSLTDDELETRAQAAASAMDRTAMEQMLAPAMAEQTGMDSQTVANYLAGMKDEELANYVMQALRQSISESYAAETEAKLADMTSGEIAALADAWMAGLDEAYLSDMYDDYMPATMSDSNYDDNIEKLGVIDPESPSSISIFASTFENKDSIIEIVNSYNKKVTDEGHEENIIAYTDYVGIIMKSVSRIINIISYVLIAFVSISLIVSSIMIGIITYISVLERTKEIGILRSIGASKRDVSSVFNAETLIVGFASGLFGIIITVLLCIPASAIVKNLAGISNIARLPAGAAVILVLISMALTFISGLIPARIAAKKDPVEALRTE